MDLTTNTATATVIATSTSPTKSSPDTENDTPPPPPLPIKPLSFSNGSLKNKKHHHHRRHLLPSAVVVYKECLKNHAAGLGGHALDGCGEFMPSPNANTSEPASLKCAACGCHRNFHRRDPDDSAVFTAQFIEFHRHNPFPLRRSPSPTPPAPQMLLALSSAASDGDLANYQTVATPATPTALKAENPNGRKRFRTKFSQEQKEKMLSFSEKLNWKMQKCDESLVEEFCNEIGVARGVLKVWMHNNKNTFAKKEIFNNNHHHHSATINNVVNGIIRFDKINNGHSLKNIEEIHHHHHHHDNGITTTDLHLHVSANGSSSSA